MKKLLFLGACLVALASQPVMAQTGGAESEVTVVQVEFIGFDNYRFRISHGEGKTEVYTVKAKDNSLVEAVQKQVAQLYQQGYALKGEFRTNGAGTTMMVFVKGR
jgi:hypothetical protein